jgi:AcrR family transcriptional regulator
VARIKNPENNETMRLKFRKAFTTLLQKFKWEEVTIKNICNEAQVSPGLFYYYFSSKEEIMRDKYEAFDENFSKTVRALSAGHTLFESMLLYVSVYITKCQEKGPNYMAQMIKYYLDDHHNNNEWHGNRGFFTILMELIDRAKAEGEIIEKQTTRDMAHGFASSLRGHVLQWCASPETFDLTAGSRDLVRFYYLGWKQISHEIFSSVLQNQYAVNHLTVNGSGRFS